jgi:hypothetical protein
MIIDSIGNYRKGLAAKKMECYLLKYVALRNSIREAIQNHIISAQVSFYQGNYCQRLSESTAYPAFKSWRIPPHYILGVYSRGRINRIGRRLHNPTMEGNFISRK